MKNRRSVQETIQSINAACRSKGGHYANYSCKTVSWDDVSRGTVGGALSCWGANITDTRLWAKDGRQLYTVRSDNWNERLGRTNTDKVALVASSVDGGGGNSGLRPITLKSLLKDPRSFASYAGLKVDDLSHDLLDKTVSIRFQTTFLPVPEGEKQTIEFAPEAYNYNTRSDSDPRNLVVLCTSQGLAVQQDGAGAKKLFHHHANAEGDVTRHWLEAESSNHAVGTSQTETKEEREDALNRGKATASVIGIESMGTRFNALMTLQIPLQQKQKDEARSYAGAVPAGLFGAVPVIKPQSCSSDVFFLCSDSDDCAGAVPEVMPAPCVSFASAGSFGAVKKTRSRKKSAAPRNATPLRGVASAARVSKGTQVEGESKWKKLTCEPVRNESECITVTIVMYYVVQGGTPTADDVVAAVDDLEKLYKSCEEGHGNLNDDTFQFMKKELLVKDVVDINKKLKEQPPPPPQPVSNFNVFPSS